MNEKLFIDSDIILDLLTQREPFYHGAAQVFTLAHEKKIELYTSAVILANVFYIIRKIKGNTSAKQQLRSLRLLVSVLPINETVVDMALNSNFNDFEDGLQYFAVKEYNLLTIITRNTMDYKTGDVIIKTAVEYLKTKKK